MVQNDTDTYRSTKHICVVLPTYRVAQSRRYPVFPRCRRGVISAYSTDSSTVHTVNITAVLGASQNVQFLNSPLSEMQVSCDEEGNDN